MLFTIYSMTHIVHYTTYHISWVLCAHIRYKLVLDMEPPLAMISTLARACWRLASTNATHLFSSGSDNAGIICFHDRETVIKSHFSPVAACNKRVDSRHRHFSFSFLLLSVCSSRMYESLWEGSWNFKYSLLFVSLLVGPENFSTIAII